MLTNFDFCSIISLVKRRNACSRKHCGSMSEMTYCLFVLQNFVMIFCRTGDKSSACRKSLFLKYTSDLLSLSPNPFPSERGYITGATAPRPCRGLRPCDPIFKNYIGFSTDWKSYLFRFYVDGYTTKVYNIYVCLIENLERKD